MATFAEALPGLQAQGYGNVMEALAAYNAANQAAYFGTPAPTNTYSAPASPVTTSAYDSGGGGISSLPVSTDYTNLVNQAYKDVLGRAGESTGVDWWASQLSSGQMTPEKFQESFRAAAAPELSVQNLYTNVLGRDYDMPGLEYWTKQIGGGGIAPEEYKQFYAAGVPEILSSGYQNVLGRSVENDPGAQYWKDILSTQFLAPSEFARQLAGGATGADLVPAQQYLALGSQNYLTDFAKNQSRIEKTYGLEPGSLSTNFSAADLANKNIDELQQIYQQSGANKFQEANRLANIAKTAYGYSDDQAKSLVSSLLKGESKDETINSFYQDLLKGGMSKDLQAKIIADAAQKTPDSPYFQANPEALQVYKPIGELKSTKENEVGQYGYYKNAPNLSAKVAEDILGNDVYKGSNFISGKDDKLGWDLNSKYTAQIARGAGVFGVTASNKDVTDFDKIIKEIDKLGGIKKEQDAEGNVRQVVYKDVVDPESGRTVKQAVDVRSLFATGNDEYGDGGYEKFKSYEQTKEALEKGAAQLGIDSSKYDSIKDLYNAVNDKSQNLFAVTGRANNWDPEISQAEGLTGAGQSRGGINNATVLYQKTGDKLVPLQILNKFNFDDPNTSRGVLGDIAQGALQIASVPPIAMALAAATGGISGLAAPLTAPITASLVEAGLPQLVASSITNSLVSSGIGALTGGDWQKTLGASLASNLIGGATGASKAPLTDKYVYGFSPGYGEQFLNTIGYSDTDIAGLVKPETLAKLGGVYAGSRISGLNPEKVLLNQIISQGIRSLPRESTTRSRFGDDLIALDDSSESGFVLNPYQKDDLEQEYKRLMAEGVVETPGITGLSLRQEDWMIDALRDIVPLFMAKGLSKADSTMLAGNLINAASRG